MSAFSHPGVNPILISDSLSDGLCASSQQLRGWVRGRGWRQQTDEKSTRSSEALSTEEHMRGWGSAAGPPPRSSAGRAGNSHQLPTSSLSIPGDVVGVDSELAVPMSAFLLLLLFSHPVMSDSLWPHGLQHTRPPCPSPPLRVCPSLCPSHQWCRPAISSSDALFSFCPQSFPASGGFFQWVICSHLMTKILELQLQHESFQWIFRDDLP